MLCVDLHAHVGDVLRLSSSDVTRLHALGDETVATIARLLDTAIDVDVAIIDDEHQERRTSLELVAGSVEHVSNHVAATSEIALHDVWLLAASRDPTAVTLVDLHELDDELLHLGPV